MNKKDLCSYYLLKLKKILNSNLELSPKSLPYRTVTNEIKSKKNYKVPIKRVSIIFIGALEMVGLKFN